jgi:hypothetical protein
LLEREKASKQLLLTSDASVSLPSTSISTESQQQLMNYKPEIKTPISAAIIQRKEPPKVPVPKWHAPWELSAVVSGHLGVYIISSRILPILFPHYFLLC